MTLVTISTVKGAPGGTTLALLLARALAEQPGNDACVLAECDLSGGDLAPMLGLPGVPGLASLALTARHGIDRKAVLAHVQQSAKLPGVNLLLGIAGPEQGIALGWIFEQLGEVLREPGLRAVADLGRQGHENDPNEAFRRGSAANLVVTSESVASLLHTRAAVESARRQGLEAKVVLIGNRSHRLSEVAEATSAPVVGAIRFDPEGLSHLLGLSPLVARLAWRPGRSRRRRSAATRAAALRSDVISLADELSQLFHAGNPAACEGGVAAR
jgi:MinD-like ATPase involved in chromosome partitioning or flagellar assembly